MGIATQSYTKEFFDPLPDAALVFVCTCIEHAIREYESGRFSMIRFKGKNAKGKVLIVGVATMSMGLTDFLLFSDRSGDTISQNF